MTKLLRSIFIFVVAIIGSMAFDVTASAEEIVVDNTIPYTVSEGSVYWESSEYGGSGIHNTVCDENRYTDINSGKLNVWVDGYSIIDQNGNIVKSYFNEKVQKFSIPETTVEQKLMLHILYAEKLNTT